MYRISISQSGEKPSIGVAPLLWRKRCSHEVRAITKTAVQISMIYLENFPTFCRELDILPFERYDR